MSGRIASFFPLRRSSRFIDRRGRRFLPVQGENVVGGDAQKPRIETEESQAMAFRRQNFPALFFQGLQKPLGDVRPFGAFRNREALS